MAILNGNQELKSNFISKEIWMETQEIQDLELVNQLSAEDEEYWWCWFFLFPKITDVFPSFLRTKMLAGNKIRLLFCFCIGAFITT